MDVTARLQKEGRDAAVQRVLHMRLQHHVSDYPPPCPPVHTYLRHSTWGPRAPRAWGTPKCKADRRFAAPRCSQSCRLCMNHRPRVSEGDTSMPQTLYPALDTMHGVCVYGMGRTCRDGGGWGADRQHHVNNNKTRSGTVHDAQQTQRRANNT